MGASVAYVGCKVSASLATSSSKLDKSARPASVSSAFSLKPIASRVSCSLEDNVMSIVDGFKASAIILASSALLARVGCVREREKKTAALTDNIAFNITKSNADMFESVQPSDSDLGSKASKEVKI